MSEYGVTVNEFDTKKGAFEHRLNDSFYFDYFTCHKSRRLHEGRRKEILFQKRLNLFVNSALTLPAEVAEFRWIGNFVEALGGNTIADGDVALSPEWMVRKRVLLQVESNITVGPFENGKKFVSGFFPHEDIETLSRW
jgi:hypothetical protein